MDYEKKYKEALERAKIYSFDYPIEVVQDIITDIFPELKESEDEKIRKALIENFKWFRSNQPDTAKWGKDDGLFVKDIIAWLEKQGEHKPFNYESANIQQKDFAPKVEPKFKVGDWITNGFGNPMQISSIDDDMYDGDMYFVNNDTASGYIESTDKEYHLWTIQDAKDGDVLVDTYGNIGVFQKTGSFSWTSYCFMWKSGSFVNFGGTHENDKTYPATKEQRDLLFLKMKEEGYEFDFDKKELKKIK